MKKQKILVDVDGCLLNWNSTFINFMTDKGYQINEKYPSVYEMEKYFNITKNEMMSNITEFNDGSSWRFGALPEIKNSSIMIKKLADAGFRFTAISSCSDKIESLNLRKANLYHIFGDVFDEVYCIKLWSSKSHILSQFEPTFWIEDNLSGANQGLENNHNCFIIDHPWNRNEHSNEITRVNDWSEIYVHIMKENE